MIKDLHPGEHTIEVLQEAGYPHKVKKKTNNIIYHVIYNTCASQEITQLMTDGVVVQYKEDSKL